MDDGEILLARPKFARVLPTRVEDPESEANDGYRLLDQLRDKVHGMLLLTATPMQLHDFELYSMIELVEPGLFNGYADFASSRVQTAAINKAVSILRSDQPSRTATDECRELLYLYEAPPELLELANGPRQGRQVAATWLARCHRLSEALVRNRKTEIGGFTHRVAHRIDVVPSEEEVSLERDVQLYIRKRYAAAAGKQSAVGLVLVAFQKMLCSSSRALAGALESRARRLRNESEESRDPGENDPEHAALRRDLRELPSDDARGEAETLGRLARRARRIDDSKLAALETLVESILARQPGEKVLIFSQFLDSIEMIRERLAARHSVRVFHGGMTREEKDRAHQAFRSGIQVLVSSEAGGEGRNFQFCHVIINYDLPWNPMKIEQRIGRVDRVGQTRDVEIYNFAVRGMLDERILGVLEDRIQIFTETVGALDPILESFEEEVTKIALGQAGEASAAFERLDADLDTEIARAQELEVLRRDFVLDWRSLQRDTASRALGRAPRATRDDLETFSRAAIGRFGSYGSIEPHLEGGLFVQIPGIVRKIRPGVEEDYRGSFDVHEALRDEGMHFFAMGHPMVEALLDNVGNPWWLPATVLESDAWTTREPGILVDYRLELHGIRPSGLLISHVVSDAGVRPAVPVRQPNDPSLEVRFPTLPAAESTRLAMLSLDAARVEAINHFEEFKKEHAAIVEQELERLRRMYDSRRAFLDDRILRNEHEVDRLESEGTQSQRRIIPAVRGRITADRGRIGEIEDERKNRVDGVHAELPSYRLVLLGAAMIVRPGGLEELKL
jgi:hypothetical protein